MDDQWTFQCEIQKRHPLRDETSTDETTPKPDRPRPHLGRNRVLAYGPVTFPHSGVSRMSASVRLMIQGHSARRVTSRVRQCHKLIKISEIKSATTGATALSYSTARAQNTHTLHDPIRDTEHARAGGVEDGLGVGGLDGGGDVGNVMREEAAGGRAALAVSRVVGGAGEACLAREEAEDGHE